MKWWIYPILAAICVCAGVVIAEDQATMLGTLFVMTEVLLMRQVVEGIVNGTK